MKGLSLIVDPAGPYRVEEFDGGLVELQAVVGGYIEPAPSHESVTIWCNEDGKSLGLLVNRLAMDVWIRWDVHRCMLGGDYLVGNVVVTGGVDRRDGETLDLPDEARRWIERVADEAGAVRWGRFGLVDDSDER